MRHNSLASSANSKDQCVLHRTSKIIVWELRGVNGFRGKAQPFSSSSKLQCVLHRTSEIGVWGLRGAKGVERQGTTLLLHQQAPMCITQNK